MPISLPARGLRPRFDRGLCVGVGEETGVPAGVVLDVAGDVPPEPDEPCTFGLGALAAGDPPPIEAHPTATSPLSIRTVATRTDPAAFSNLFTFI
jgi:hypothetical protein